MQLTYKKYFSKVYGCWLGKCISGNVGAPYEGMKQKLSLVYDARYLENMLPNDDLDLQVLWLEVLREKGADFTSDDLAEIFAEACPYAPGEYAFFKRNHRRGIPAPYAGTYNNFYFQNGMGAPIRSEIWACVAPCNPSLAAEFAARDAVIDHGAQSCSLYGERFFAALESMAFGCDDIPVLVRKAQKFVSKKSRLYDLIDDVYDWAEKYGDIERVRDIIVNRYGNVEATDCLQNIGFILASLMLCNKDFIATTMAAVNCGFDTDCTGATVGAILGIILGAEKLLSCVGNIDVKFKLGVKSRFESDRAEDLARETAKLGVTLSKSVNKKCSIEGFDGKTAAFVSDSAELALGVEYDGDPDIGFGEIKKVRLKVRNRTQSPLGIKVDCEANAPLAVRAEINDYMIDASGSIEVPLCVSCDDSALRLPDGNVVRVRIKTEKRIYPFEFGLAGKTSWLISKPYWKNIVQVPPLNKGESYWAYFDASTEEKQFDAIRHYHMNSLPDVTERSVDAPADGEIIQIGPDVLVLDEHVRFTGQAAYWLDTAFYSDEEREIGGIQIGYTDAFRFYLNGTLLCERNDANMYTPENVHIFRVRVKKGINRVKVMLVWHHAKVLFSYNLLTAGVTSDHLQLDHVNLKYIREENALKENELQTAATQMSTVDEREGTK